MGGNAKYKNARFRTVTGTDNNGNQQVVNDQTGNPLRVAERAQVGRKNRTNTTATNARERMLNADAIKDIRDTAKFIRNFHAKYSGIGKVTGSNWQEYLKDADKAVREQEKLAKLANQIQPNVGDAILWPNRYTQQQIDTAWNEVEKILNVKVR